MTEDDYFLYFSFTIIAILFVGLFIGGVYTASLPTDVEGNITLIDYNHNSFKIDSMSYNEGCPNLHVDTLHIGEHIEFIQQHSAWPYDTSCTILVKP